MQTVFIHADTFEALTAGSPESKARNGHNCLAFDAAAVESATYTFMMPSDYNSGSNVTASVAGMATSATSNNTRVRLEIERLALAGQDLDSNGFYGTPSEANAAAAATSGVLFASSHTLANADLDSCAAGDFMRVKVTRVGDDGTNDTMTGDWEFVYLKLTQ